MAAVDSDYLQELFSSLGRVAVRRMFGGAGIFADGLMIGLVSGGDIYLKADGETASAFEREGMKPFSYGKQRRRVILSFWRLPDRLLDDPDELAGWARTSLGAARRSAEKRPVKSKRRPRERAAVKWQKTSKKKAPRKSKRRR